MPPTPGLGGPMDYKGTVNAAFDGLELDETLGKTVQPDTMQERQDIDHPQSPSHAQSIPERPEREQWANKREFLLTCISMAVGVGNVWRFPFVALENGGGAFLIPYILVLIFIGKPLYYLEFCIGQFSSFGPIKVWQLSPAFKGVGCAQAFCTWIVATYYVSLMAMCVYYFFASFSSILPWSSCGPWASPYCVDINSNSTFVLNDTAQAITPSEEYFMNQVLKIDPEGFKNGLGYPDWHMAGCLLTSWILIFVVQAWGVKSSGKAAYFTAFFPYIVLFTILIRGATLPGAMKGVLFFITPRWEKLIDPGVWYAAVDQAFFSLSVGFGIVVMLSSYNGFRNNVYNDATIISLADTLTSLLAGFTTFAILGNLAEELGVEVQNVVKGGGTALAFVSFPDALARFQVAPQVFSVLFFLMMFTLGLGSAIPYTGVIITAICDQFPHLIKWQVTLGVCISGMLVGILYTIPQGQYILTLLNHYAGGVPIFALMIFELVGVVWVYGLPRLLKDIEFMLNRKTGMYWKVCWGVFNPLFLIVVFIYSQATASPLKYGSYVFDDVATGIGIGIATMAILMVPLMFLVQLYQTHISNDSPSIINSLGKVFRPAYDWGPKDSILNQEYHQFLLSKKNGLGNCK
ncbi:hypothetical protein Pcinc_009757 [Petrolisthes cinctipes]|uniref:Transporter n=1 Tax=Petrolisthes cinctipes TaxID=88211 RepID=A0AAE1FPJ1_PETCI|nr:hypothetical protein Pcinc_017300 [Petrolisthes cinctipes]KAK3886071.1 hypothetical protein Pcinc_009757 [Petrolisthes cinctipes]